VQCFSAASKIDNGLLGPEGTFTISHPPGDLRGSRTTGQPAESAILPAVRNKSSSSRPLTVSIVGAGNLGTALALTLPAAGYEVKFIGVRAKAVSRTASKGFARKVKARLVDLGTGAPASSPAVGEKPLDTDIVWITVPDDSIAQVSRRLAGTQVWRGRVVFHSSGALTSDELAPLRAKGARVASVHPMMTFVRGSVPNMDGVAFAIEGDAAAVRAAKAIVERLGGYAFSIRKPNKVLYHAFGSFASPLVIALMASLEQVAKAAGIRPDDIKAVMLPLLQQTLRNYLKRDAASAFSGPLVRGDVATLRKHLAGLKKVPEAREVYVALAKAAVKHLPVKNRSELERALKSAVR
jgi:predicted short-subunit dehydrogenase-like oxidoreductase (DUF2520 family)